MFRARSACSVSILRSLDLRAKTLCLCSCSVAASVVSSASPRSAPAACTADAAADQGSSALASEKRLTTLCERRM